MPKLRVLFLILLGAIVIGGALFLVVVLAGPTAVYAPYILVNKGRVLKKSQRYLDTQFPDTFLVSKVYSALNAANMDKKLYSILVLDKKDQAVSFEIPWNDRFPDGGNTPEEIIERFVLAKELFLLSKQLSLFLEQHGLSESDCRVLSKEKLEIIVYEKLDNENKYDVFKKVYASIHSWQESESISNFHFEIDFIAPSFRKKKDKIGYFIHASWKGVNSYKDLNDHLFVMNDEGTKKKVHSVAETFLMEQLDGPRILDDNHYYRFVNRENITQSQFYFFYCTKKNRKHIFCAEEEGMVQCLYDDETGKVSELNIETDIFNADGTLKILKESPKKQ